MWGSCAGRTRLPLCVTDKDREGRHEPSARKLEGVKTPGTRGRSEHRDEVHRITNAADSLRQDQSRRAKRYLLQMGIRLACFAGAFFADGWLMWALLAGAVLLPYVAVVSANETRVKGQETQGPLMEYYQLPSAEGTTGPYGPASSRPTTEDPPVYVHVMDPEGPGDGPRSRPTSGPGEDGGSTTPQADDAPPAAQHDERHP